MVTMVAGGYRGGRKPSGEGLIGDWHMEHDFLGKDLMTGGGMEKKGEKRHKNYKGLRRNMFPTACRNLGVLPLKGPHSMDGYSQKFRY